MKPGADIMSENKPYIQIIMALIIFVTAGSMLAGTTPEVSLIVMNTECYDGIDNDGGGQMDVDFQDSGCLMYPYTDGTGETETPAPASFTQDQKRYQTGYDVLSDYTLWGIQEGCGGDISGCGVPGVSNEVQFFCFLDANGQTSFIQIVQVWAIASLWDDGSYSLIDELCYQGNPNSYTQLPVINFQQFETLNDK